MADTAIIPAQSSELPFYEVIASETLAERLGLPLSWVRDQVRSRASDPIPCLRFGRYVRFQWLHPDLMAWLDRRRSVKKVRVQ